MPKTPRSRLRDLGEYLFVRAMEGLLRPLPISAMERVGRGMGWLSWLLDRRHRRVAEENVAWALGLSAAEARRLVRQVYRHSGMSSVECLMLPHILRRRGLADFTEFEGGEHLGAALARGRGAIVLTAHIGNWEIAGLFLAQQAGSLLSVARTLDNPLLEAKLRGIRERLGQTVVDRHGALRPVLQQLRRGGAVGMLIDQNQRKDGVFVEFFGRLASTTPSPAAIALKYDVPVLSGYSRRVGNGLFFRMHLDPPFDLIRTGDHEKDVLANTAMFTRRIEEWVRQCPEQWVWLHSRWRTRPPEEKSALKAQCAAQAPAEVRARK